MESRISGPLALGGSSSALSIGIGIIGAVVLIVFRPEELANFIGAISTLLGIGSAAVITIYGLGQQGKQLETIKKQTNGNLNAQIEENQRLTDIIIAAGLQTAPRGAHRAAGE